MIFRIIMSTTLLILGASTRAAAFSALSAGLSPVCADLFADADLSARCPVSGVPHYPHGLVRAAESAGPGPWMYTGGLENRPDLVERIAANRTLFGNSASVLRRVRDPSLVSRALLAAGLVVPELRPTSQGLSCDGRWLRKPRRGSGGAGIEVWTSAARERARNGSCYFQQYVAGRPCAAIYLAARGTACLLGATEQILLRSEDGSPGFRYAGSIGPLPAHAQRDGALARIGNALVSEFDLRGLFGVDFVDDGQTVWPIEVNPRYTASIEILERAGGFSGVGQHVSACRDGMLPDPPDKVAASGWHAKRVIYAGREAIISEAFTASALGANPDGLPPALADIPPQGTTLKPGQPVMTVFASGPSREATASALDQSMRFWQEQLARCFIAAIR
jgi:predicted ATP-grasp superfamily ATP-dependent carboligase